MNAWLTEDGRKAIEVMGWPEWEDGDRFSIRSNSQQLWYLWVLEDDADIWIRNAAVTQHIAIPLLRDHARQWLEKHGVQVEQYPCELGMKYIITKWYTLPMPQDCLFFDGTNFAGSNGKDMLPFDTYDAALIAAVLAVGGGK